ncbi:MAG TPA: hypothetical protein PLQ93_11835 [Bacteroidia bacterium]|nr:hypothetical protein [Bacteroidia bacterium]
MKNSNFPLKKTIQLLGICLILLGTTVKAQDKILLKNGDELKVTVLEISEHEVKYKIYGEENGPLRVMAKSEIFLITYANGKKEVMETGEAPVEQMNQNIPPQRYATPAPVKTAQKPKPKPDVFDPDTSDFAKKKRKNFSGPRVGFTYITDGTTADYLVRHNLRPSTVQFGWQFEARLFTVEDGTSGLVAFVPFIGGIDQGKIFPSANFLLGLRGGSERSWEFALGPHFGLKYDQNDEVQGAVGLVLAFGTSFKKGNVWFPINLAVVPSVGSVGTIKDANGASSTQTEKFQTGWKITLTAGFNTRRK